MLLQIQDRKYNFPTKFLYEENLEKKYNINTILSSSKITKHLETTRRSSGQRHSGKSDGGTEPYASKEDHEATFSTGSTYYGTWDNTDMDGYGFYNFFYGVEYDGEIKIGMFNDRGTLMYPNNAKMDGFWKNGRMVAHRYFYSDNLCFGPYCEMPDRRYNLELREGIRPTCKSLLTNSYNTRTIPEGCYDAGDGFYDPVKMCVYDPIDNKKIIRIPTKDQHDWIIKHCRKAWDEPVKYKPSLYESWQEDLLDTDEGDEDKNTKNLRKSLDFLNYKRNKSFVNENNFSSFSNASGYL